jgi:hypothetical protein
MAAGAFVLEGAISPSQVLVSAAWATGQALD